MEEGEILCRVRVRARDAGRVQVENLVPRYVDVGVLPVGQVPARYYRTSIGVNLR